MKALRWTIVLILLLVGGYAWHAARSRPAADAAAEPLVAPVALSLSSPSAEPGASPEQPQPDATSLTQHAEAAQPPSPATPATPAGPATPALPGPAPAADPAQQAKAVSLYDQGLKLLAEGKPIEGRRALSQALAGGALDAPRQRNCRQRLALLADEMIMGPRAYPGDPLTRIYAIAGGDMLAAIVKREKLRVPYEAVARVNGISNPASLRVGQKIKLLQGPFNLVITKHAYTLDLYLQDVFVRSFRVGLGRDNSTPLGRWRVRDRMRHAPWTSPEGGVFYPDQPEYPLGREGIWIALQGTEPANETFGGFGIHGTNEPATIGAQASHGCVRLADEDIALLYDLLDRGTTVEVRP